MKTYIEILIEGPEHSNSESEEDLSYLKFIYSIMDNKLIKPEHFTDDVLAKKITSHCGWEYNHLLILHLFKWIPIEQWVRFRNDENKDIFHTVLRSDAQSVQIEELWDILFGKPELAELLKNSIDPPMEDSVRMLHIKITNDLLNLGFKDEGALALHHLLRTYRSSKFPKDWEKVYDMYNLMLSCGIDLKYEDIDGNTLLTAIHFHGWAEVFSRPRTDKPEKFIGWDDIVSTGFETSDINDPNAERYDSIVHQLILKLKHYETCKHIDEIKHVVKSIIEVLKPIPNYYLRYVYINIMANNCLYDFIFIREIRDIFE
jgi:hypothetical protein